MTDKLKVVFNPDNFDDFEGFVSVIEDSGVDLQLTEFRVPGVHGMYKNGTIFLNMDGAYADLFPKRVVFALLHELGHYKRDQKTDIDRIYNMEDSQEIFDIMVQEERIADRYASFLYYKIFGEETSRDLKYRCYNMNYQQEKFMKDHCEMCANYNNEEMNTYINENILGEEVNIGP